MKQEFDKVMYVAGKVMDKAAQQAAVAAQNGRNQVELHRLNRRLAKAQKQLGALVYMLHKTGQESEAMVAHYIDEIDEVKAQIELHEARKDMESKKVCCAMCGALGMGDMLFCRRCGARMPK